LWYTTNVLYQREHYQASARVESTLDYRCAFCDFAGNGDVEGSGSGSAGAIGLPGGGLHGGMEMAQDAANASAWQLAFAAMDLAPCPRCDKRQPGAVARYAKSQLGGSLKWGLLTAVLLFLLLLSGAVRSGIHVPVLVGLGGGVLVAATLLVIRVRRGLQASYLVQWRDL
jgi:hypothetical protein